MPKTPQLSSKEEKEIEEASTISFQDIEIARGAFHRNAPREFRYLLDAQPMPRKNK